MYILLSSLSIKGCVGELHSFYLKTFSHREVTDLSFLLMVGAENTTDEGPRKDSLRNFS